MLNRNRVLGTMPVSMRATALSTCNHVYKPSRSPGRVRNRDERIFTCFTFENRYIVQCTHRCRTAFSRRVIRPCAVRRVAFWLSGIHLNFGLLLPVCICIHQRPRTEAL